MEPILRAGDRWPELIARALRVVPRPIAVDPRLMPRAVTTSATAGAVPPTARSSLPVARAASTLLVVYPGTDGELCLPLTVRHAGMRAHAGEISLPGGAVDPSDASREAAALREAWEEVGLPPKDVRVLGRLDDVWIPVSNFELRPFVGAVASRPQLVPHAAEVADIVELPLRALTEGAISDELIEGPGWALQAGAYRHGDHVIWGATARCLDMFATVLRNIAPD